jgi:hypothetical protein
MIFFACAHAAKAVSSPTIIKPEHNAILAPDTTLRITGLTQAGSTVYFFLDGKLIGGKKTKAKKNGVSSFSFIVKKNLSVGAHTLQAQATLKNEKSAITERRRFDIPRYWPRRIDGVSVGASKANNLPIAVMIENLPSVRPQYGLASASVVYETLAEGGIPRLLAIFAPEKLPKQIGPVRSARPYFVDWAKEYQASFLHAGGSRDAFTEIGKLIVRSVDALVRRSAKYFYRIASRAAPHNLFTNNTRIRQHRIDAGIQDAKASFRSWKFHEDPALKYRPEETKQLTIDFQSGSSYVVRYSYDRMTNSWMRENGGKPHGDANVRGLGSVKAKNVVVQLVERERILDQKKRIALKITGSGNGWILQDGTMRAIQWRKKSASDRTIYYEKNGREIVFTRGTTWIEVVPKNRKILWK